VLGVAQRPRPRDPDCLGDLCRQHRNLCRTPHGVGISSLLKRSFAASASSSGHGLAEPQTVLEVDRVLENVRQALGVTAPLQHQVAISGTGTHVGTDVEWRSTVCPSGAFVEEMAGEHLSFRSGFDGASGSTCWEVDDSGVSKRIELDDHESLLIATWVRHCHWVHPSASSCLEIVLLEGAERAQEGRGGASAGNGAPPGDHVTLGLKLVDGRVQAQLKICTRTWEPVEMLQPLCGETEVWRFSGWTRHAAGLAQPAEVVHLGAAGGQHCYRTVSVERSRPSLPPGSFAMPPAPIRPADTSYLPGEPARVKAWHARSGHVLVKPKINGREVGYMILDTGASGFVIEKGLADELGLEAFGELYVSGMAAKVQCQFRRAETVEIGPMVMQKPLFMEMMLGGLVRGAPGPVVGIVGYEVFRRAVIELPPQESGDGEYDIYFHDPEDYDPPLGGGGKWQNLTMVANLPHVTAAFAHAKHGDDVSLHEGMFMLDSGAGGVDAMFHARSSAELGLLDENSNNFRFIKGVGGDKVSSIKVQSGNLEWLELSSSKLKQVRCLFGGNGALDLSLYTVGIICADLMGRMNVIVDYARSRIAFVDPKQVD